VGNLTLKRGLVATNELFNWYMKVAAGTIERRNLSVIIYTTNNEELRRWNFFDVYPVRWVGPTLSTDMTAAAVEVMELSHAGMQLG
jgi:phage tail-like protein